MKPTTSELQAALAIASGFGKMTNGNLLLSLLPINQLTPEMQQTHHLILVGDLETISLFENIDWPIELDKESLNEFGIQSDDGVIQMAVSPWNESRVILVATGQTDEAISKAGRAISIWGTSLF